MHRFAWALTSSAIVMALQGLWCLEDDTTAALVFFGSSNCWRTLSNCCRKRAIAGDGYGTAPCSGSSTFRWALQGGRKLSN
jgi:hypothetical protein